jgi:glycosyltransferase involved in cell wall biosynthesis
MKKILLLTFEYPVGKKYCGGVGQIVKQCRASLLALGYRVYVLISLEFQKKYPVKLLQPDGFLIHYNNLFSFEKEYSWLGFDYIIQHFVNWTQELRKVKNHKCPRPKIVYHFHSILRRERESGFRTLNHFLLNQEKMIALADKIICPSRYEYNNFCRYFPNFSEKLTVIENTIETFSSSKKILRDIIIKYGIRKDDVVAIYVGRLERIKGAEVIVNHISKLLNRHKNLKIFIIGKALEKDLYRKLMRALKRFPQQLFYIRYLEKERLFQLYYLSHIYINPSLSESFSLATHESVLCNNALLLNRLSIFDKFRNAALFFSSQEANDNEFISKFEYLIKHKKIRRRLSQKAARIAKEFLANNRLEEDLSKFLKSF